MRGRRSNRKKSNIIVSRSFLILIISLITIIVAAFGMIKIRKGINQSKIAKQAKELDNQTYEIFSKMDNKLANITANPSDGEAMKTKIVKISAVGDILCQMDMINSAKTENGYDFSNMFSNITEFTKNSDITLGTLETNFADEEYSGSRKI